MISYQTSGDAAGLLTFLIWIQPPAAKGSVPLFCHNQKHLFICPIILTTSCSCGWAQLALFPVEFFPARLLSCSRPALTPPRVILGRKIRTLVCVLLCLWGHTATQLTTTSENESTVRTSMVFQVVILPLRH